MNLCSLSFCLSSLSISTFLWVLSWFIDCWTVFCVHIVILYYNKSINSISICYMTCFIGIVTIGKHVLVANDVDQGVINCCTLLASITGWIFICFTVVHLLPILLQGGFSFVLLHLFANNLDLPFYIVVLYYSFILRLCIVCIASTVAMHFCCSSMV